MRFSFFSRHEDPDPGQPASQAPQPVDPGAHAPQPSTPSSNQQPAQPRPLTGRTFPADEVVWGIAIRNGFDELDDPWYHRGTTQHAYLEGNDNVAICGFRPPQSGPRTRRRSRLGLPTTGEHPMCGICARMVVAPRPRVPIPVSSSRPSVAVPVFRPAALAPRASVAPLASAAPAAALQPGAALTPAAAPGPSPTTVSPWVRQRAGVEELRTPVELASSHDGGLLARGIHSSTPD